MPFPTQYFEKIPKQFPVEENNSPPYHAVDLVTAEVDKRENASAMYMFQP